MATVAHLDVKIGADIKDFESKMQGVTARMKGVGEKMQQVGKTLTTRLSLPLAAVGAGMLKAASDAQEMQTKFNTVFANTGQGVTAALSDFGNTVGRSTVELKGMASQLGDTLKPMGFAEDAAAGLAVDLTKLATDLSSFNNMPMDEALRRLQGTLVGSHENALAFGVVINENTLKARMLEDGTADLTGAQFEQAKVQARINLLMEGTRDAQGDAARTADGFANKVRALRGRLQDIAVEFGQHIIPLATRVVEKITGLANWFGNLSEKSQRLVLIIGGVAAALPPLAAAIGTVMAVMSPWAVLIAGVVAAGTALVMNWDSIKEWVEGNFPLVAAGVSLAIDVIVGVFENMWTVAKHTWDQIVNYFSTAVEVITGIAGVFFDVFTGNWSGAWDGVKDIFGSIWEGITEAFRLAIQAIKDVMPGFVQDWLGWTDDVAMDTGKMEEALSDTATQADDTAKSFGGGSDLANALGSITSKMNTEVSPAVRKVTKDLEDAQEPATRVAENLITLGARGTEMASALDPASVSLRTLGDDADDVTASIEEADRTTASFSNSMAAFGRGFMDSVSGFEVLFGDIGGRFGTLLNTTDLLINQTFPAIKTLIGGIDSALGAFGINLERQFHSLAAFAGGYGNLIGMAGVAGVFIQAGRNLFGSQERPWERMGISEEEWRAQFQNVVLQGGALGGLTGVGGLSSGDLAGIGGLNFGSGWLQGTAGRVSNGATITLNVNGTTFAEALLPSIQGEIDLAIG